MVLLAAAVCNKSGKALVSRQFVEMTRSRIEGLLAAFPKLMSGDKQHTFIETESVRYVYQPLEKLYVLLLTTKASNILEDLETLRLFARVIPEYSSSMEEKDILENAFQLIFAFDEIVALGYRENVNLAQIKTFTEMDSHEEKVFLAVRTAQEKEAKNAMRQRAKEIATQRKLMANRGSGMGGKMGGFGASNTMPSTFVDTVPSMPAAPEPAKSKPAVPSSGRAMKLGSKSKDVDSFVDQLKSEGEQIISVPSGVTPSGVTSAPVSNVAREPVHLRLEEKLTCEAGRDGGIQSLELTGMLHLHCSEEDARFVKIHVNQVPNVRSKFVQTQCHPNIDKKMFLSSGWVQLKQTDKGFPISQDIGVVKWRSASDDEALLPLTINCWPNPNPSGGFEVTVEYEITADTPPLENVVIVIPLPGSAQVKVNSCDGDYRVDQRKNLLEWSLISIDPEENPTGNLDVVVSGSGATEDSFFPISVQLSSGHSLAGIAVEAVKGTAGNAGDVKFSSEERFYTDGYKIV